MSFLEGLQNVSKAVGAANPLIGLGTSVIGGAVNMLRNRKMKQEQEALDAQIEDEKVAAQGFRDMVSANMTASTVPNAPIFAGGGSLQSVLGQKHPQGGTPYGAVELEKGETVYNDNFVFSDRIKPPRTKYTYAQMSKTIKNKFKSKLDDPVENKEMQRQLNELAIQQEQQKVKEGTYQIPAGNANPQKMSEGGPFDPLNATSLLKSLSLYGSDAAQSKTKLSELGLNIPSAADEEQDVKYPGAFKDFIKGSGNELLQAAGNTYNVLRGLTGLGTKSWDENLETVDFEDYWNENAKVDLDLVDPTREIAEANKQFNKAQYSLAQNARGQGNLLSNLVAAGTQSAEKVSDIVHRANRENVDISNKEKIHNAEQIVRDSTNLLNSKIFNAQTQHKEMEWEAANKDNLSNMIERGIQGFSQQANARELNRAKATELDTLFSLLPKESMSPDAYGNAVVALMKLKSSYGR